MKTQELSNKLALSENEGWNFVPFNREDNQSFYSYAIENGNLTLAWIAYKETITVEDLKLHHFIREEPEVDGIKNSLPRLLIATNGLNWYISHIGGPRFTEVKLATVLVCLYNEIKTCRALVGKLEEQQKLVNNLTYGMKRLKLEAKKMGKVIAENSNKSKVDLFSGFGIAYDAVCNYAIQNLKLESKEGELKKFSILLHRFLRNNLSGAQIDYLKQYTGNYIYVNPFYQKGQLLVFVERHYYKDTNGMVKYKSYFLMLDKYAKIKTLNPSQNSLENEILPGLFKFDLKNFTASKHINPF